MNGKFYVCSKFSDVVFYVMLPYITDRLVTASTVRHDTLQFLTLREGGKGHYIINK